MNSDARNLSQTALIALGSNLPAGVLGPEDTLSAALEALQGPATRLIAASRFYHTPCFPKGAGPDYVNAAAKLETTLSPLQLLVELHEVEARFGRQRKARWGTRTLDLDLLAHGSVIAPERKTWDYWHELAPESQQQLAPQELVLPHPRLAERAFVLVPLAEVAPEWVHPVTGRTVEAMRDALPEAELAEVRPLSLR